MASLLVHAGVDPKTVQTRLGHKDVRVTLNTYAHLYEGADQATAAALDSLGLADGDAGGMHGGSTFNALPSSSRQEPLDAQGDASRWA
jgi:hypothetical protein